MIPTKADDATQERYVSNILTAWHSASPKQLTEGRAWYPAARKVAQMLCGSDQPDKIKAAAGVIAALSPQKAWDYNVDLAKNVFETGEIRGHVRNALDKVEKIMLGKDPIVVLPEDSKTWNFFVCIYDPSHPDAVVIDRHAHDVAAGEIYGNKDRGLSNKTRYATIAHAYGEAARRLGELPQAVQAVVWTVQVDLTAPMPFRSARNYKKS